MTNRYGIGVMPVTMGVLLVAVVAAGCALEKTVPAKITETSGTPESLGTTAMGTAAGEAPLRLVSVRVGSAPVLDGEVDTLWAAAVPLRLPVTWGMDSAEHAAHVVLRSAHSEEMLYFLAQWPGKAPSGEDNVILNRLTVHWDVRDLKSDETQHLDCTVVCHTAFVNGHGDIVYVNAETIPQGNWETLPSAGGWQFGVWTLEWARPLRSDNPYDLQFRVLDAEYPFFVKIFEGLAGHADPVSEPAVLVFQS